MSDLDPGGAFKPSHLSDAEWEAQIARAHLLWAPKPSNAGPFWRNIDANDLEQEEGSASVRTAYDQRSYPSDDLPGRAGPAQWTGPAPERRFIMPGWIAVGSAGLLGGQDGVGKSLMAQLLATCAAAGVPFLGQPVEHCNALYITCEDGSDELHRRQEAINEGLGITMQSLEGRLDTFSLKGQIDNVLGATGEGGAFEPTKRFKQIRQSALAFGARLVFLDNAAHLFAGNENARHDVATFLSLLERLSIEIDGAAVLLAHPNKQHSQGNKQGNEYSGSTGWSAHVRNRLFLDWTDGDDPDERVLRRSKANYAARGEEIVCRWHRWTFKREQDLPADYAAELTATIRATAENKRFIECLEKATEERRTTSHNPAASNYAPRLFAKMTIGKGTSEEGFAAAMERLLHLGQITGDQRLWQRDNRTWASGLACTKPCTKPAQSGAQSLHEPAHAPSEAPHMLAPPILHIGSAPLGAGAPPDDDGFDMLDAWEREG